MHQKGHFYLSIFNHHTFSELFFRFYMFRSTKRNINKVKLFSPGDVTIECVPRIWNQARQELMNFT